MATTTWSPYAKRLCALSMYHKGKHFIAAAILLRQNGGYEYVVLHLLCQGIENILKGLLLFKDFDQHQSKLKGKKGYGHNLLKLSGDVLGTFGLSPARLPLTKELESLNSYYSQHLLRYGSFADILIDARTIPNERVLRRIAAGIRLIERELAHTASP